MAVKLLSYYKKGSYKYIGAICSVCADKNKDQTADYYCYDCLKHLCKACLVTHNRLKKNHIVVQGHGDEKMRLQKKCGKHTDELITMYCLEHSELICIRCCRQDHRTCKDVKNVKETASQVSADTDHDLSALHSVGGEKGEDRSVATPRNKSSIEEKYARKKKIFQINIRIPEDRNRCDIKGCCRLSDGYLMIADINNKRLKRVDPSSGIVVKYCDTNTEPWDVCCIGPQEVAVAFSSIKVRVYSAASLIQTRTIQLGHDTHCIACHGSLLYAGWERTLYAHDLSDGRKLWEIRPYDPKNRDRYFDSYPSRYSSDIDKYDIVSSNITGIALKGYRVYVSGCGGLACVNKNGKRIFSLSEEDLRLGGASGVTTDDRGHVLVCGVDSGNVVEVTEEGQVIGQTLSYRDEIWSPQRLSYDVSTSRLYVGRSYSDQLLGFEFL